MSTKAGKQVTIRSRQTPLLVKCDVCNKKVDSKKTLKCAVCKKSYEFDCIGYSQKLHLLKDIETRNKWKCKMCAQTKTCNTEPISSTSYVTQRKKPASPKILNIRESMMSTPKSVESESRQDSHVLTSDDESLFGQALSTSDKLLQRSLDYTVTDKATIAELKNEINQLQIEHSSTQNELENYIIENNKLRTQNSKLTKENTILKKLCRAPLKDNPTIRTTKNTDRLSMTDYMCTPLRNPDIKKNNYTSDNELQVSTLQQRINKLEQQLSVAEEEILTLTKHISYLEADLGTPFLQQNISNISPLPEKKKDRRKKLLIYGSQQCVGLSSALIRSRENTMYEKYTVTAQTKPYALTSDILKDCKNISIESNDKLVIGIGENDYDMNIILSQLRKLCIKFKYIDIIVLNLFKNMYLNVYELNDNIRRLCKEFNQCHFVSCKDKSVLGLCKSINYVIDCIDYEKKYLNARELKKLIANNNNRIFELNKISKKYTKGTIPYYFEPVRYRNASPDIHSESIKPTKAKDKITDYFPISKRNQLFRTT